MGRCSSYRVATVGNMKHNNAIYEDVPVFAYDIPVQCFSTQSTTHPACLPLTLLATMPVTMGNSAVAFLSRNGLYLILLARRIRLTGHWRCLRDGSIMRAPTRQPASGLNTALYSHQHAGLFGKRFVNRSGRITLNSL